MLMRRRLLLLNRRTIDVHLVRIVRHERLRVQKRWAQRTRAGEVLAGAVRPVFSRGLFPCHIVMVGMALDARGCKYAALIMVNPPLWLPLRACSHPFLDTRGGLGEEVFQLGEGGHKEEGGKRRESLHIQQLVFYDSRYKLLAFGSRQLSRAGRPRVAQYASWWRDGSRQRRRHP